MAGYGKSDDGKPKGKKRSKEQLLEDARKRFKLVIAAEADQRKNELEDLKFQHPDLQWSDEARREREGNQNAGGVPFPPRPIISVDKLSQPCNNVLNQARQAHLGIEIHPRSPDATDDTAEVQRGLYRKIEVDSRADVARMWALDRAIKAGRGYYRILTKYDDDSENKFDQVIAIDRIKYQDSVYWDPSATHTDNSDAKWAFLVAWVTEEEYEAQTGKKAPEGKLEWEQLQRSMPEWVRVGDECPLMIAEHWYKETVTHKIQALASGGMVKKGEDLPDGDELMTDDETGETPEREVEETILHYCKLGPGEVMEQRDWPVPYIPIVTVVGNELQPVEGKSRYIGIIRNAREPQRAYNWAFANAIEAAAREPRSPWIATPDQIEGHEEMWQQSNTRNLPVLLYNLQQDQTGSQLPPPARVGVSSQPMSASLELIQIADHALQATTQVFDPSLGRTNQKEQSGKAIQSLQNQSDLATSVYIYGLATISMPYEAKVILAYMPITYDRPGRVLHILDLEGQTKPVMLNAPYAEAPGQPPRALPPTPPGMAPIANPGETVKHFDLKAGVYSANVTVGKAKDTLREEADERLGALMQQNPDFAIALGPTYYRNQDFPGHEQVAEIFGKMRDQKMPFLADKDQQSPQKLQAQLHQQGQQIDQMGKALQQAHQELSTKQAEQQAKIQVAQVDAQMKLRIAEMENATKIEVARISAAKESLDARMAAIEESIALGQQQAHEADQNTQQQAHEAAMAQMQHSQGMDQQQAGADQQMAQQAAQGPPQEAPPGNGGV